MYNFVDLLFNVYSTLFACMFARESSHCLHRMLPLRHAREYSQMILRHWGHSYDVSRVACSLTESSFTIPLLHRKTLVLLYSVVSIVICLWVCLLC